MEDAADIGLEFEELKEGDQQVLNGDNSQEEKKRGGKAVDRVDGAHVPELAKKTAAHSQTLAPPTLAPPTPSAQPAPATKELSSETICWFWIGFVLLEIFSIVRTSMLIMRKTDYSLDWSTCEIQTNVTDQEEPEEPDNVKSYFRASDILYVIHSLLHWPEYGFLAYGTYKLMKEVQTWDETFKTNVLRDMKRLFSGTMKTEKHTTKESKFRTLISVVFVFIFIVASLVISVISIAEARIEKNRFPNCEKQNKQLTIHYGYQFLSILAHIVSPAIRIYMAIMVLAIQAIWFPCNENNHPVSCYEFEHNHEFEIAPSSDDAEVDLRAASSKHYDCVMAYKLRQNKITAILHVFRAWFVIQWFIYYFQFLVDLSRILRPWLKGAGVIFDLAYAHRVIYTIYDLFAFIIPHVSGLKMNQHHENYLKYLRQEQLEDARDPKKEGTKLRHTIAYLLPIDKHSDCDFIPVIPGTGIHIPLDSPGYVLGLLLTIFALAGSLVTFV